MAKVSYTADEIAEMLASARIVANLFEKLHAAVSDIPASSSSEARTCSLQLLSAEMHLSRLDLMCRNNIAAAEREAATAKRQKNQDRKKKRKS